MQFQWRYPLGPKLENSFMGFFESEVIPQSNKNTVLHKCESFLYFNKKLKI